MAPSAVIQEKMQEGNYNGNPVNGSATMVEKGIKSLKLTGTSVKNPTARYLMDRDLNNVPLNVINSKGNYLYLSNGQEILDSSGGAAVAALGHGNAEVKQAMIDQMDKSTYFNSMLFTTDPNGELAEEVIRGTGHLMSKMFVCSSGSEATEAALKMARQYFIDSRPAQPQRTKYIAREHSYHGNTIGALSLSGHLARRAIYEPILTTNVSWISACNTYRQQLPAESIPEFVSRKAEELDAKFRSLGPETVIAFVCEPVPGASLGCILPPPGYLTAMKAVCRKYGALFILDEVMSGMGRTGTLHAWQSDHDPSDPTQDCVPDIQMVGKGLGGGYQPIAGVLAGHDVINTLSKGTGAFIHGQTYQAHPVACAAALAVQRIIRRDNLLSNVKTQGEYLESLLRKHLDAHPFVGNIRGRGLFWGIEFVENKMTKEPFPQNLNVATRFAESALKEWSIAVYPGQGTVDGVQGDHVLLAPAYIVQNEDVEEIVKRVVECANAFFEKLEDEIAATTAK